MRISEEKRDKISEQILFFLYSLYPKSQFTYTIAKEVARDEEFTKKLLMDLKSKKMVKSVNKNPSGKEYIRRIRWSLNDNIYLNYKKIENN